jgi:uncharacterized phage protein gp47/JayE
MSEFRRLTLDELARQARSAINANLADADARLAQNNLDVLAIMSSGLTDEQLNAIDYHARQMFVTTCDGIWLDRHGAEWGVPRKVETYAQGVIEITGQAGIIIPETTIFQTGNRVQFATADEVEIGAQGRAEVAVAALAAGPDSNILAGADLSAFNSLGGITGAVAAIDFFGGAAREAEADYRNRILDRIQSPPQGGAESDYRAWALAFPGVTRAWVYPLEWGPGTVAVRFAMDTSYPNGIPTPADAAALHAYLEVLRPVTAELYVFAPAAQAINIEIRDLTPRTPATEIAVRDEMLDLFQREGFPGVIMRQSWFWEAASIASGVRHHKIMLPADDVALAIGTMPILGTIAYV